MSLTRRTVVAGLGLVGGSAVVLDKFRRHDPDHVIVAANLQETSREITVETELGGEERTYGPTELADGESWRVARIDQRGELTVRFWVDGERVWEDTHEIPTLEGSRSSIVLLEIQPDGELLRRVKVED